MVHLMLRTVVAEEWMDFSRPPYLKVAPLDYQLGRISVETIGKKDLKEMGL